MPRFTKPAAGVKVSKFSPCTYLKRNGSVCGKRCVGGTCGAHMRCAPHVACSLCGKGTQSVTGICTTPGPCRTAQHTALIAAQRATKRASPAGSSVLDAELDALIGELLDDFAVEGKVCEIMPEKQVIPDVAKIYHKACGEICDDSVIYTFREGNCRPFMIEPDTETWEYSINCTYCKTLLYQTSFGTHSKWVCNHKGCSGLEVVGESFESGGLALLYGRQMAVSKCRTICQGAPPKKDRQPDEL